MESKLSFEQADSLKAPFDLERVSWKQLINYFETCYHDVTENPNGMYAIDPRNNEPCLFNPKRAKRPHDYGKSEHQNNKIETCPICMGDTTTILDLQTFDDDFSFINANLYPMVSPISEFSKKPNTDKSSTIDNYKGKTQGFHFLHWTSSFHDRDWPALKQKQRTLVLEQIGRLEQRLLSLPDCPFLQKEVKSSSPYCGYVTIIKNAGLKVGGSLRHPHQQIAFGNIMPRRVRENLLFYKNHQEYYAAFMLRENPNDLCVKEYKKGRLVVPFFMRRPFDLQFFLSDTDKSYIYQLSDEEKETVGNVLADGMLLLESSMVDMKLEIAYNLVFHTGPGAGFYIEFLPSTQALGGFEHMGLSVCQSAPKLVAETLRTKMNEYHYEVEH